MECKILKCLDGVEGVDFLGESLEESFLVGGRLGVGCLGEIGAVMVGALEVKVGILEEHRDHQAAVAMVEALEVVLVVAMVMVVQVVTVEVHLELQVDGFRGDLMVVMVVMVEVQEEHQEHLELQVDGSLGDLMVVMVDFLG